MKDMNELKRRLGKDRRFFAYFHPALEDEPIIFVQVALTNGLGKSIQEITKPRSDGDQKYDTATFYSISNCQEGLSRVTLGNFLIKRVVFEIQEELPNIKHFGTLSPIPGFRDWFSYLEDNKIKNIIEKPKLIFILLLICLVSFGYYSKNFKLDAVSYTHLTLPTKRIV